MKITIDNGNSCELTQEEVQELAKILYYILLHLEPTVQRYEKAKKAYDTLKKLQYLANKEKNNDN